MLHLLISILRGKKKKFLPLTAGIAICFFFVIVVDMMYRSYCSAQISNAYSYSGNWDICVKIDGKDYADYADTLEGITKTALHSTTYCLRLDTIPEELIMEETSYVTDYYLALYGIEKNAANALTYKLTKGRFPETENEIVIPETLQYDGRSASKGTIQIGDTLTMEYGRRLTQDGIYTQNEISGKETFEAHGEKEYTICGFIEYHEYRTDVFVLHGYVGLNSAEVYPNEELNVYYKLDDLSIVNMNRVYNQLSMMPGTISVEQNTFLMLALDVVENSDYMHSVRFGLYLFEALLVIIGLCIAGANQYQSIVEDRQQICNLYTIGASKGQLCILYSMMNFVIVLMGFVLSLGLYGIFLFILRNSLLAKMRNFLFDVEQYTIDGVLISVALVIMLIVLSCIVCKIVLAQIPARRETKKKHKNIRQQEVTRLSALVSANNRTMRTKSWIQVLVLCVILLTVPVFCSAFLSSYRVGKQITEQWSADFFCGHNGYWSDYLGLVEELKDNPYVKDFRVEPFGPKTIELPAKYFPEKLLDVIKSSVSTANYTEKDTVVESTYLCFVTEEYYEYLNEINEGKLPPYEEFASGNNCIIYCTAFVPDTGVWFSEYETGEWVDVGKTMVEYAESIALYPYMEEPVIHVNVIASVSNINYELEHGLNLRVFVPEHIYENYCKGTDMHIETFYRINGYDESLTQLWESLKDLKTRYDVILQDNVSESSMAKDSLVIQYITCGSCIAMVLLLCAGALGVMGKIDFVARRQTYNTYRLLGLDRKKAFWIQFTEQLLPFVNAALISVLLHYLAAFTFLKNVYGYYEISLKEIGIFYLWTILGILLVLLLHALFITRRRYKRIAVPRCGD